MLGSQGVVVKCTSAIFFPTVDCDEPSRSSQRLLGSFLLRAGRGSLSIGMSKKAHNKGWFLGE